MMSKRLALAAIPLAAGFGLSAFVTPSAQAMNQKVTPQVVSVTPGVKMTGCQPGPSVPPWYPTKANCKITSKDSLSTMGFTVDYWVGSGSSHPSRVMNARSAHCKVYGGTCKVKIHYTRHKENDNGPARVALKYKGKIKQGGVTIETVSGSLWLEVRSKSGAKIGQD